MFNSSDIYIDLGTANTLVYLRGKGFILNEPSVIATRATARNPKQLFGLGQVAKAMLGKNPSNISVIRPLREGVIADFDSTSRMLHSYINRFKENHFWLRPRMIISLPCEVTYYEKRAVEEIGYNLGAARVQLLDEPVAAAIGAGLRVLDNKGQMVVDIGGGTTEIAVISLGGIIASSAVRVGGNKIDDAIIHHLRQQHNFLIGEQTAERVKVLIGNVDPESCQNKEIEVGGIDLTSGLPKHFHLRSEHIAPAVEIVVKEIISAIRQTLESIPPEISGDLIESGLVIAGGGALLSGLKARLSKEIGLTVNIASDPLYSVARGGALALEDKKLFEALDRPA